MMITMCDYGTSFVYRCVEKNPAKEGVQEEKKNYKKREIGDPESVSAVQKFTSPDVC